MPRKRGAPPFNLAEWRAKNRSRIRRNQHRHQIFKLYGLTVERYDEMLKAQHGRCDICGEPMRKPCVDHNHVTGKVRGLLCNDCNLTLGWIERPEKRAAFDAYIARYDQS